MQVRVMQDRGNLAEPVSERRQPGRSSASELKSGDVVVGHDGGPGRPGVVPRSEAASDIGPQRLAAVAVIVPLLTALILAAWLWLR